MLDYDDTSKVAIYNDACIEGAGGFQTFLGLEAIRGFFADLFQTLTADSGVQLPVFIEPTLTDPGVANPIVEPEGAIVNESHVFLVWNAVDRNILKATDTFLWKEGFKIKKQNIAVTQPAGCSAPGHRQMAEVQARTDDAIEAAWENHWSSFQSKDHVAILNDYRETSIIRYFDWSHEPTLQYNDHTGLSGIQQMYRNMFAAMTAASRDGSIGFSHPIQFPQLEASLQSAFSVWSTYSHPQATSTYVFDDEGKIVRQTIVVTSATDSAVAVAV